jgi:hypothetical protein
MGDAKPSYDGKVQHPVKQQQHNDNRSRRRLVGSARKDCEKSAQKSTKESSKERNITAEHWMFKPKKRRRLWKEWKLEMIPEQLRFVTHASFDQNRMRMRTALRI